MDKQNDDDDVFQLENIKIVAEKEISFLFEDAVIGSRKGMFGDFYTVYKNGENGPSSC